MRMKSIALLIVALLTMGALVGCKPGDPGRSTGSYPIDIFQEMHYNQSHKSQEPPRFMPPKGSIPVKGGFIPAPKRGDAKNLKNPLSDANRSEVIELGALLFRQNCSMCHGMTGGGDGQVGIAFGAYPAPAPPAISDERIQTLTEGEAYSTISNGYGYMPAFQSLLSESDRWAIIQLVKATKAERANAHNAANQFADGPDIGDDTEIERAQRLIDLRANIANR